MSRYQGKALESPRRTRARRKPASPLSRPLRVLAIMLALLALAMLPWGELRARMLVVGRVRVTGLRYLDAEQVRRRSGLAAGQDLLSLDLARARQLVLMEPRVRQARVRPAGRRAVQSRVAGRAPACAETA